ncbi:amino acid permease [Saccharopolyspora sp. CA-218241]|uniref:amino acid permease n=1 Tax=Saccharopolyspora sp. CA-218241 TaxID=3240027 RepID=UPI003D961596
MALRLGTSRRLASSAAALPLALGGMIGGGAVLGMAPAAAAAGPWSLVGVVVAAVTAGCAATATSYQAQHYPGGAAVYAASRSRLGVLPARITSSAHLAGHVAALAAVAGALGELLLPAAAGPTGAVAVLLVVLAATAGLRIRGGAAWAWLLLMFGVLAIVVVLCWAIPPAPAMAGDRSGADEAVGIPGAAGLLFFAFLGFERLSAPEPDDDRFTPRASGRAVLLALVVAAVVLLALGWSALHQLGAARLALSAVPLRDLLGAAAAAELAPLLCTAAAVALLPVLLAVLESARPTTTAAVEDGDLPGALRRFGAHGTPYVQDLLVGGAAAVLVLLVDPVVAMAVASCCLLAHHAFGSAAARVLLADERRWPTRAACAGMGLSVVLLMSMPIAAMLATLAVVIVGPVVMGAVSRRWS